LPIEVPVAAQVRHAAFFQARQHRDGRAAIARGNLRGRIIWLGLMAFVVYTYAMNSFEVKQNPLFIPYIVLLCLATLSVAGGAVLSLWPICMMT